MKIYRVDADAGGVFPDLHDGSIVRLVKASSLSKARDHVLRLVRAKVASQEDMMMAVGKDAIEIEEASDE